MVNTIYIGHVSISKCQMDTFKQDGKVNVGLWLLIAKEKVGNK